MSDYHIHSVRISSYFPRFHGIHLKLLLSESTLLYQLKVTLDREQNEIFEDVLEPIQGDFINQVVASAKKGDCVHCYSLEFYQKKAT
jgi:hypothetical protein